LIRPVVSQTFHGRDIMALVAAHLSLSVEPKEVEPKLGKIRQVHMPRPRLTKAGLAGRLIGVDDFGNLVTNIDAPRACASTRLARTLWLAWGTKVFV
jgi:S-adenosylmethionine hydrolase